jgi:hypothetical protein
LGHWRGIDEKKWTGQQNADKKQLAAKRHQNCPPPAGLALGEETLFKHESSFLRHAKCNPGAADMRVKSAILAGIARHGPARLRNITQAFRYSGGHGLWR